MRGPTAPWGRKGRIVLYAGGRTYQFAVDELPPKSRRPLGKTGLEVELVKFDPAFLAVQLLIHHGKLPPQTMHLLADVPELCEQDYRDGVFGTFWYDATRPPGATAGLSSSATTGLRPAPGSSSRAENTVGQANRGTHDPAAGEPPAELLREAAAPRIDLLQGADGKLYYRAWSDAKWSGAGPMPPEGKRIDIFAGTPAAASLTVDRFLPSAKPDVMPVPEPFSKTVVAPRRQVRVRLTVDGKEEEFWLGATSADPLEPPPENAQKVVVGKDRRVILQLRPDEVGLGVQVFLHKFRRRLEPGGQPGLLLFQPARLPRRRRPQLAEQRAGDPQPAGRFHRPCHGPRLSPLSEQLRRTVAAGKARSSRGRRRRSAAAALFVLVDAQLRSGPRLEIPRLPDDRLRRLLPLFLEVSAADAPRRRRRPPRRFC